MPTKKTNFCKKSKPKKIKRNSIPIIHGKAELELHDAEVRAKAIDEFADKMIIMMPGHKADILMIAEQLKEGGK